MSEHDRDVLALLDRAAADTPPLHLDRADVVARGEQIVRRRRTASAGMGLAGLALAGAVWAGLGGSGLVGLSPVVPAGTTWQVPEGVVLSAPSVDGQPWPEVVLTKDGPDGYGSVRIGSGEDAQTVDGELVGGGLVVYPGREMTVGVWEVPEGADGLAVVSGSASEERSPVDGEPVDVPGGRLDFVFAGVDTEVSEAITQVPRWGGADVVAASGARVVTDRVGQGGFATEVYVLPDARGLWGVVGENQYPASSEQVLQVASGRPWWRGGGAAVVHLGVLGDDATRVRATISGESDPDDLFAIAPGAVEEVGGLRLGVVGVTEAGLSGVQGLGPEVVQMSGLEWAAADGVWHRQRWEPTSVSWEPRGVVDGEVAGPGEEVTLLGTTYTVAIDPHGWPQLLDAEDGSLFLRVTDEQGPAAGGMVDMTRWRWPWETDAAIYFAVGDGVPGVLPTELDAGGTEHVTIEGPEGQVRLVGVPKR